MEKGKYYAVEPNEQGLQVIAGPAKGTRATIRALQAMEINRKVDFRVLKVTTELLTAEVEQTTRVRVAEAEPKKKGKKEAPDA